jgi:hypothetical protein
LKEPRGGLLGLASQGVPPVRHVLSLAPRGDGGNV